jgi:flavin reductase (DIM6/NTAB) family NADH-FMN oxidoreductase RutF
MKDLDYMSVAEDSINKIKEGAFLTVKSGNALNTMAIGWATFGVVWGKPIMMVAVRSSRHTFGLIEAAKDFTVTVPAGDMRKEIAFCGTKSGRNVDKFKMCNLETAESGRVVSPIIKTQGRHYECQIIYKSAMNPAHFHKAYDSSIYPKKDYHTLYFGEILACYENRQISKRIEQPL